MKTMQTQEEYYSGVRMLRYDLLKELVLAVAGVGIVVLGLSAFLSSPDVAPVTIATWAQNDPVDFETTATNELAGSTTSAAYGNPYNTNGPGQSWGPLAPQKWFGTRIPIDSANEFVIQPLQRAASSNTALSAQLDVWQDWVYSGRFHHLFGRFTYMGQPVHGFGSTQYGAPTDGYGRLIYLDTHNSAYGSGWKRENSFLPHKPTGVFCYGFYPFDPTKSGYVHPPGQTAIRGPGNGSQYRITVEGPGVTPDIMWTGTGLHDYNARNPADVSYEEQQNAQLDKIVGVDKLCRTP